MRNNPTNEDKSTQRGCFNKCRPLTVIAIWAWTRVCTATLLWYGCTSCSKENSEAADFTGAVRCCRVDAADLPHDFEQAIFSQNGFCIMGRSREDRYELILGHVDSLDKSVIICCDAANQPREIFAEDVLICLNDVSDGGMYVDIVPKDSEPYGFLCDTGYSSKTRASGEAGDQAASSISFGLSLQSLKEYSEIVFGPVKNYLNPKYANVYSQAGKALARPGLIFSAIGLAGAGVDMPRWVENLTNAGALVTDAAFWTKFGGGAISGPLSMFIGSYLGLYERYRELYEEHISTLYGNCMAVTGEAAIEGTSATLSGEITGYEPGYDLECGISVSTLPEDDSSLQEVTCDGGFSRAVDGLEPGKTYRYRAFVISKTRMSLWAGPLGDLAGPLVRYGAWKKFTVPEKVSIVGTWHGVSYTEKCSECPEDYMWAIADFRSNPWTWTFHEDGTGEFVWYIYKDGYEPTPISYSINSAENVLNVTTIGIEYEYHFTIVELTATRLTVLFTSTSNGCGETHKVTVGFERIE